MVFLKHMVIIYFKTSSWLMIKLLKTTSLTIKCLQCRDIFVKCILLSTCILIEKLRFIKKKTEI